MIEQQLTGRALLALEKIPAVTALSLRKSTTSLQRYTAGKSFVAAAICTR